MGKAGSPSVLVLYPEYTGSFQNIFISPPEKKKNNIVSVSGVQHSDSIFL